MRARAALLTTSATNNWSFTWSLTTNSAARAMGYPATNTTAAASSTSPNLVDLGYPSALNIFMRESTVDGYETTATYKGGIWVPFDASFGSFMSLPAESMPQFVDFTQATTRLTIQVLDDSGAQVSLNGMEWRMLIRRYGKYPEVAHLPY